MPTISKSKLGRGVLRVSFAMLVFIPFDSSVAPISHLFVVSVSRHCGFARKYALVVVWPWFGEMLPLA